MFSTDLKIELTLDEEAERAKAAQPLIGETPEPSVQGTSLRDPSQQLSVKRVLSRVSTCCPNCFGLVLRVLDNQASRVPSERLVWTRGDTRHTDAYVG